MKISEIIKEATKSLSKYGEFDIGSKEDLKILLPNLYKFVYNIPEKRTVPLEVILKVYFWKLKYGLI